MKIYKRNQGRWTRGLTAGAVCAMAMWGGYSLYSTLSGNQAGIYLSAGIGLAVVIGLSVLALWFVNRTKTADFLIATESEMKKVSWSSRKEVIGSTKVVIVTTFILAALLFLVDVVFANFFQLINVTG